jgi:hypothetical protein
MPDLVAKMPHQGTVRLAHLRPPALALTVVGLDQCNGDQAIVVSGENLGAARIWAVRQELECQAVLGIVDPVGERQLQTQQRIE